MKRSTKAVLLSGFVFPGAGHFYLKQFAVGTLLACGSVYALYFIVSQTVSRALEVAETIQREAVPLNVDAIASLVAEQSHGAESSSLSLATFALIALWVVGIVDSYRVGRTLDKIDDASSDKKA